MFIFQRISKRERFEESSRKKNSVTVSCVYSVRKIPPHCLRAHIIPRAWKEAFRERHVFRAVFQRLNTRLLFSSPSRDDTKPKPMTRARFRVTKTQARYGPGKHSQVVSRRLAPLRVPRWTSEKKYAACWVTAD